MFNSSQDADQMPPPPCPLIVNAELKRRRDGADSSVMPARRLKLRRPDVCVGCQRNLAAGDEAWWDLTRRSVTCVACWRPASVPPSASELDRGRPGGSPHRE